MKNIYETVREVAALERFVDLIRAAGLQDMLSGEGPLTVFAPSNDAFGRVPGRTAEETFGDPDRLRAVMRDHIVRARITAADIRQQGQTRVATAGGDPIAVAWSPDERRIVVHDARVVQADIAAKNGIVHIVDYPVGLALGEAHAR